MVLLELDEVFGTKGSEPARGVAQYVLYSRRCKLGYPADCQYNNDDKSIDRHLTNDIVHQQLVTCKNVSISVAAIVPTREVLHGCHLSHRCRCDHREDPCRDVNVGQTLSIGENGTSGLQA